MSMNMKERCRTYETSAPVDGRKYVVYQYIHGLIVATYYKSLADADAKKNGLRA